MHILSDWQGMLFQQDTFVCPKAQHNSNKTNASPARAAMQHHRPCQTKSCHSSSQEYVRVGGTDSACFIQSTALKILQNQSRSKYLFYCKKNLYFISTGKITMAYAIAHNKINSSEETHIKVNGYVHTASLSAGVLNQEAHSKLPREIQ